MNRDTYPIALVVSGIMLEEEHDNRTIPNRDSFAKPNKKKIRQPDINKIKMIRIIVYKNT